MIDLIIIFILIILIFNTIINIELYSISSSENNKLENYPKVSILVPVRNEEDTIEECLSSLINQDYPNYEIIVLNDHSNDKSPEIIKNICNKYPQKIRYIDGKTLEEGWTGKNYACYQLAKEAEGDWFLFTDADTIHKENSITTMIKEAELKKLDFITLLPFKTTKSIIGHTFLSIVNFFFGVLFPGILLSSKIRFFAFALGPFILIKKNLYWKIGGHKTIKNKVVEDVFLSRKVKEYGGKIAIINGWNFLKVFYYNNFEETWKGFSKNFFGALENSISLAILLVLLIILTFLYPTWTFFYNMLSFHKYELVNIIQLILILAIWIIMVKFYKEPISIIILYPICFFVTFLILFNSIYMSINKKVIEWKKRTYEV